MARQLGTGELRQRITIQHMTEAADGAGQPIPTWGEAATVWGLYQPGAGVETSDVGAQVRAIVIGRVTIRRYDGLTPKMRLVVNGSGAIDLVLNIAAVTLPDPTTGLMVLMVAQPEPEVVQ